MPAAPSRRVPAPPGAMVYIAYNVMGGRACSCLGPSQTNGGRTRAAAHPLHPSHARRFVPHTGIHHDTGAPNPQPTINAGELKRFPGFLRTSSKGLAYSGRIFFNTASRPSFRFERGETFSSYYKHSWEKGTTTTPHLMGNNKC